MNLAERLRRRRAALGYTQTQFGHLLGVSDSRVAALERGDWSCALPLPLAKRIAQVLECPVTDLGCPPRPRKPHQTFRRAHGDPSTLGDRLLLLRCKVALTQEVLAARVGVHPTVISHWERDRRRPNRMMLGRLAQALACRVEDFVTATSP